MAKENTAEETRESFPFRVAERYDALGLLGRGGMASVYKAWDHATNAAVALKVLTLPAEPNQRPRAIELFEREFHTLMHLSHPRVVRALDYGVEADRPHYAMELLDGGDLRELAPLPWQDVCTIAYEICSALSLLHSRRLVHRDLTPRNIRRTHSGQAKLIDFGLLSPTGPATLLAGTPPFVAPELVRTLSLDGRSDLFSLGATLYYALTRRQPYAARSFDQLQDAWRTSPVRPSNLVPGVPAALDDLLLGMLRVDVGSRPKSAAEVMERLVPLLPSAPDDELRAARAYLYTPKLVGRDAVVAQLRRQMMRALRGKGGGVALVGGEGSGRTRLLDAFVLEAKLVGATVVRAGHADAGRPFGVAASLARQIHRATPAVAFAAAAAFPAVAGTLYPDGGGATAVTPELADVSRPDLDRIAVQSALRTWILEFSARRPLAIAVDDLDRIDEPSAALLASLTSAAASRRLVYATVLLPEHTGGNGPAEIVRKHAEEIRVEPLAAEETTALLASLFGNVPNLNAVSTRLAVLSGGRPRECMTFAQHLVDECVITYAGGSWTLPAELPDHVVPASLEDALSRRLAQLGSLARHVGAMLAENLLDRLSRADLLALHLATPAQVDRALDELVSAHVVMGDPSGYALSGATVARILSASLDPGDKVRIHDELAALHERAGRHLLLVAYHGLLGSNPEAVLDRLEPETTTSELRTAFSLGAARTLGDPEAAHALDVVSLVAERLGRPRREIQSIWSMLAGASARGADPKYFYRVAEPWLRRLKHDSGYDDWHGLDPSLDPPTRALMAVGAAMRRHEDAAEADRVQPPQAAIQALVGYVVFSIAISARVLDRRLQTSLEELLVPFAPLNPMVAAMRLNARATAFNGQGRRELAHEAFVEVLAQLENVTGAELAYVENVRAAVIYALATVDVALAVPSPWLARYAENGDENQRVTALYLQKVDALQRGDWELAESYRQKGELLSLQTKASSMFSSLGEEVEVHAVARDVTGVRRARAAIRAMAEKFPGWAPMMHHADAEYLRVCGDLDGALAALAANLATGEEGARRDAWIFASRVLRVVLLAELGRAEEALACGNEELARCAELGMRLQARNLCRAMAWAEATLGRHDAARRRIESVIAEQKALGVRGLPLGYSYEVAARIALAAKDADAFRTFAAFTREEYHPGKSSVLGALYERLMDEGRQAGLADAGPEPAAVYHTEGSGPSLENLASLMAGCANQRERAERALGLLCDGDPPTRGHLLLYTESGLSLVASNTPCESVTEVVAFASSCVDRERHANLMETGALASVPLGTLSADFRDATGVEYDVVLLAAMLSGAFRIGGVALLAKCGASAVRSSPQLAEAIARTLIASGDAISVVAA